MANADKLDEAVARFEIAFGRFESALSRLGRSQPHREPDVDAAVAKIDNAMARIRTVLQASEA